MQIIDSTLRVEINEGHNNAKTGMPVLWNFSSRFQIKVCNFQNISYLFYAKSSVVCTIKPV